MAKLVTKRIKAALVQKAYNRVGSGRVVPIHKLDEIFRAGEGAIDGLKFRNPACTEAEMIDVAAKAIDGAISAVEVAR